MKGRPISEPAFFQKLTSVYLAAMVSAFLLYVGPGGYEQLTEYKTAALWILSGGYLAVFLLGRIELALIGALPLPTPAALWRAMDPAHKLLAGFWLLSVVSTVFSVDPATAFFGSSRREGLITLTLYLGCCLLVSARGRPAPWLAALFGGAMTLNAIVCLIQLAGYNPLGLYPQGLNYYDGNTLYAGQFLGTIGNVDVLSAVFCAAVPVFWITMVKGNGRARFLLAVPLLLCLWVLLETFVAGGILGVCGGVLLTLPVLPQSRSRRKILAIGLCVILVAGLAALYLLHDHLSGFLFEASELLHGNWEDSYGSGRIYIWRETLKLVPERLLLGGGPDTLGLRTDAAFERYDETFGLIRSAVDNAHNEYLNILVNQGLPALLLYLAALAFAAAYWIRQAPANPAAAVCGGAVLGYGIQAFFGISSPMSAPYFWLALGLLIRCAAPSAAIPEQSNKKGGRYTP